MTALFHVDTYTDPETYVLHTVNQNFYSWSLELSGYGHIPTHNYSHQAYSDVYFNGLGTSSDIYWLTITATATKQTRWSDDPYDTPSNYANPNITVADVDNGNLPIGVYSTIDPDPYVNGHFSISPQTVIYIYKIDGVKATHHVHAQPYLSWFPAYLDRYGGDWYFKVSILADGYIPPIQSNRYQMIIEQN
jgi:hypothetical protein